MLEELQGLSHEEYPPLPISSKTSFTKIYVSLFLFQINRQSGIQSIRSERTG